MAMYRISLTEGITYPASMVIFAHIASIISGSNTQAAIVYLLVRIGRYVDRRVTVKSVTEGR